MNKEFNPALEFDAFDAGIENGGLRSQYSINVVICYILANCKEKITSQIITEALVDGGIANYFEVSNAISYLLKKEDIIENENGYLEATKDCKFAIDIVEKDLPITIRNKSISLVRKLAKAEINEKENKVYIEEENDQYKVTMHVSDNDKDFMILTLYLPSFEQAELIKAQFISNPAKIYNNLMISLFDNTENV